MKKYFNQILIIVVIIGVVFLLNWIISYLGFEVKAGAEHNTSGYAWSENIGWISFNNTTGGGANYGVQIDLDTGDLSGHAWSENIGWISFNRSETGDPPSNPFKSGTPIAQYNKGNQKITGWMRVLANGGGWDGWISLENATLDVDGNWHGWAWSDMVVGWISFNGSDSGAGGNYKVISVTNQPPTVIPQTPSTPNYSSGETPAYIILSWIVNDPDPDDTFTYRIEITRKSDGVLYNSGVRSQALSITAFTINSDAFDKGLGSNFIWYDPGQQGYSWQMIVWDKQGASSGWQSGPDFYPPKHQYPLADFTWDPQEPRAGDSVQFIDQSTCYDLDSNCDGWSWDFNEDSIEDSNEQNPVTQFTSMGNKQIALQVIDSDGYTSSLIKNINVQEALPGWEEVAP